MADINDIKKLADELIDKVSSADVTYVGIKSDNIEITVKKEKREVLPSFPPQAAASLLNSGSVTKELKNSETKTAESQKGSLVKAPIVGTFYSSPSPDAAPFVSAGQQVKKGDIIYIIEAMKTMNEIECPCDGTVTMIYAENGQMLEYGQPVMTIE